MALPKSALIKRAREIKLLAMDVDGVLTGGEIIVLESGEELKIWNSKDRLGLAVVRETNLPMAFAWITGRSSKAVTAAAENLGVQHVVQNCKDKKAALETILRQQGLRFNQAAFIGDDLIDLSLLKMVGFGACPSDATIDVRKHAHYVSPFVGGKGVVRDVLEFILRAQKKWDGLVGSFLR